ncbi:unnamed protein product [Brugia timori]|uniref:Uncharacterized protein n=1 Tax=Brugia timori TaxID=42155 RepID=A0A0R3Q606_9BILA|nr:unnamed protein product [Brugia timori]
MGDDYEILDPIKTDAKTDDEAKTGPPSTPMLSSIKQPINTIATGPTIGGSRKESGKSKVKGKAILRKKDVEIEVEEQKQSKKSDNKRLSDKEQKQKNDDDRLEDVYEYESAVSSMRRAFLIATASGFLICILHSLLGIIYLGCLFHFIFFNHN